jgi:hypothetical protein
MTTVAYFAATIVVATVLLFGIRYLVRAYFRYKDSKIIICPETGEAAIVEVDAVRAALTSCVGQPDIRLQNCWRWPLNQNCGQECLTQLDVAPAECLVRGVLMRWYNSKSCVYCGNRFEEIHLTDHKPALQSPDGKLVKWSEIPIHGVENVLATYMPVCWGCYVAQSFRREHPELVVYRPWRDAVSSGKSSRL